MYESLYGGTTAPISPETVPPTPRPTVLLTDCKTHLRNVDTNNDNFLGPTEYVVFVNLMSQALGLPTAGTSYGAFHPALKANFDKLAAVDLSSEPNRFHSPLAIDIYGVGLQSLGATEVQLQHLNTVCVETAYAIQDALAPPSPAPTLGPTLTMAPTVPMPPSLAPTAFSGTVKIDNSFIISNVRGVTANDLNEPQNVIRIQFQFVYQLFIPALVAANPFPPQGTTAPGTAAPGTAVPGTTAPVLGRYLRAHQRRELVAYAPDTAKLLQFEDVLPQSFHIVDVW